MLASRVRTLGTAVGMPSCRPATSRASRRAITSHSATYKAVCAIRSLPADGDFQAALQRLRNVQVYPLAAADNPTSLEFIDLTDTPLDLTPLAWEDNIDFWRTLHAIINDERLAEKFRPMYGILKALGIDKGVPFDPDARMTGILTRAARDGRDQLLISAFASDRPDRIAWADRKWEWAALIEDNGDFETPTGPDLEARDRWFAEAQGGSPAMFRRKEGMGSLYWLGILDAHGDYLDGGATYKLTIPQPVPGSLFWSITVYDATTRTVIQTDQDLAALRSIVELSPDKLDPTTPTWISTSGRHRRPATNNTGSRRHHGVAGSATSASTALSVPPSTAPGNPATSSQPTERPSLAQRLAFARTSTLIGKSALTAASPGTRVGQAINNVWAVALCLLRLC
jgi:hypothetical protein